MKALFKTRYLVQGGMIAALYVVLTYLAQLAGLASGAVQLRLSEALTVLPMLTPAAVPGLFVGCLLANLFTGCAPWDVVCGSLATLAGALLTALLRRRRAPLWTAPLPPILCNTLVVPPVLLLVYHAEGTLPFFYLTVFAGELLSCGVLGLLLLYPLHRAARHLF